LNEWKLTGEGKGDKNGINSRRERERERERQTEKEKWGNTKDKKRR